VPADGCRSGDQPAGYSSYVALRDIEEGEEVTQSYVGIGWPQTMEEEAFSKSGTGSAAVIGAAEVAERWIPRRTYLHREYGFECHCERSVAEPPLPPLLHV
jgi:hypothetical protein